MDWIRIEVQIRKRERENAFMSEEKSSQHVVISSKISMYTTCGVSTSCYHYLHAALAVSLGRFQIQ